MNAGHAAEVIMGDILAHVGRANVRDLAADFDALDVVQHHLPAECAKDPAFVASVAASLAEMVDAFAR